MAKRSGRRPGHSGTRETIAGVAARQFAERGYGRTTIRSVAKQAGVDPALVPYFFGSKQELFVSTTELPMDPAQVVPALVAGDPDGIGERVVSFLVATLEDPEARRRLTGMARAAASEPAAADLLRERLYREVLGRVVEALGVADAALRASLVASQFVGLLMARYVVRIEPLASLPADGVVAALSPVVQHYLTARLTVEA